MTRDYYDPESRDDDLFEGETLRRRQEARAIAKAALETAQTVELRAAEELRSRLDERARETNRRQVIAEYQAAGVEPPLIDGNGKPTTSLSMLLRIGWSLETVSGVNRLIPPFGYRPPPRSADPIFAPDDESENPAR